MKFLVTSDCYRSKGRAVVAGTVLTDATEDEARDLALAGRGRVVPDDYLTPAEQAALEAEAKAKAEADEKAAADAAAKADADAKKKAEADKKAATK